MSDRLYAKRPATESTHVPTKETPSTKQRIQRAVSSTRLPTYTQAWGDQPPPWLRLPSSQQEPSGHDDEVQMKPEKENNTGIPDNLKTGIETLSGMSMDGVKVHYDSSKPAQLQALAYTQGNDIYLGPGQEKHLPHEGWHMIQQGQGRVKPTGLTQGVAINDEANLEEEASLMGTKALQMKCAECEEEEKQELHKSRMHVEDRAPIQLKKGDSCYCPGWTQFSPYTKLKEYLDQVGPGEDFTTTQANDIFQANSKKSGTGTIQPTLTSHFNSDTNVAAQRGALVTKDEASHLLAELDHIVPKEIGGCNSVNNAQIISAYENGTVKSTIYPYGGFTGLSVFDPTNNLWYPDKPSAKKGGATNVNKL